MLSLNPYAAPYIPLSQREGKDEIASELTREVSPESGYETTCSSVPSQSHNGSEQNYFQADSSFDFNIHGIEELLIGEDFREKDQQNPIDQTEKQYIDEDSEIDLAYLALIFPGISDQSLADVYSANGGDFEASVDMLNELEFDPVDISKHLPDTLDIGDVSDFKYSAEGSSLKLKSTYPGEASGSSSGPLDPTL